MKPAHLTTRAALRENEDISYIAAITACLLFSGLSATIWPPLAAAASVFFTMYTAHTLFHRV